MNNGSGFGWSVLIFGASWISLAAWNIAKRYRGDSPYNWLFVVSGILIVSGGLGFFGTGAVALGSIPLPSSFEWPVGYSDGVINRYDGLHAVPVVPAGRVQVYDSGWHFVRGWQIASLGGQFKIVFDGEGEIVVSVSRSHMRYLYSDQGILLGSYRETSGHSALPDGTATYVPTRLVLLPFSTPFGGWFLLILGMLGMGFVNKKRGLSFSGSQS